MQEAMRSLPLPVRPAAGDGIAPLALATTLAVIVAVVLATVAVAFIAKSWQGPPPVEPSWAVWRGDVRMDARPEPVERTTFLAVAALTCSTLLLAFWLLGRFRHAAAGGFATRIAALRPLPFLFGALVSIPFVTSEFLDVMFFPGAWMEQHWKEMTVGGLVVSAVMLGENQFGRRRRSRHLAGVIALAACSAVALQILPFRFFSVEAVTTEALTWGNSFDAVIYAFSQVAAGKTLLADLPSQYGLAPEVTAPLFVLTGLSVFSFVTFLGALQVAALCALAVLLHRHVRSTPLAAASFFTLLISSGLFLYLRGHATEIYLQYFPLRFFCPTVALLIFSFYSARPNLALLSALGLFSGVAIFWNVDTGVPIVAAIAATLLARTLIGRRGSPSDFIPVAAYLVIAVAALGVCFAGLRLKAGVPLKLAEALAYQRIFYGSGFGMLPLPLPFHPWQTVLAVYAAGAVAALFGWRARRSGGTTDVLFCSSILGLGLFTYYQGRSHVYCLMMVLWPAVLAGAILTDRVLRAVRRGRMPRSMIAAVYPFVLFVCLASVTLALWVPALIKAAEVSISTLRETRDPIVADELKFIRETRSGRSCLILAQRQGIYYATLGIASPVPGPGLVGTLLQKDLDDLVHAVLQGQTACIYLGTGKASEPFVGIDRTALIARYPISSASALGTMLLLEPR